MGKIFEASLPALDDYNHETIQYLRKIDISLPVLKENKFHKIGIEVRDVPEILAFVEHADRSKQRFNESAWQIHRISDEGITLDLVTHNGSRGDELKWKEGHLFIPMENVIAILNVDQVFVGYKSNLATQ